MENADEKQNGAEKSGQSSRRKRSFLEKEEIMRRYYLRLVRLDFRCFLKWMLLAALTGVIAGGISIVFGHVLSVVTSLRQEHGWLFYFLPAAGLIIVFLYQTFGKGDRGANEVFATIAARGDVPLRSAPLIFLSTVLTHLTGGSAGREGAVIQLGGSIGNYLGRLFPLDDEDRHVMVMCGMSAAFAALFGTPLAAVLFAMEVVSVGVMYYTALAPCMAAALIAAQLAAGTGLAAETFPVADVPALTLVTGGKIAILALCCAVLSIVFCLLLHGTETVYQRVLKNPYLRIAAAGLIIVLLTKLLGTTDYMGAGTNLIEEAVVEGRASSFAFLWKMILTALTMRAGFRGGEIVPSFAVGATFGCAAARFLGLPASLCAASAMAAVFCGVTNCPMTALVISFELFGFEGAVFYLIAVSVSYATSGYYGLYKDQKIVYSKYKAKYVNQHTQT